VSGGRKHLVVAGHTVRHNELQEPGALVDGHLVTSVELVIVQKV
jgi:hypothetical protein